MVDFDPVEAVVFYAVFVLSVTLHEAAHAWTARRGGDLTAYRGGQVTIDPRPHIRREPFGMVFLPLLGIALMGWPIGYASTPYDVGWSRRHPRRAAWMSLAGPGANLALVLVAAVLVRVGLGAGWFEVPGSVHFSQITAGRGAGATAALALLVSVLFSMNLVLVLLNLIPVPPLDGSGAVGLLLPEPLARRYRELVAQPGLALVGLLLAWMAIGPLFRWAFLLAVHLLYPGVRYGG